MNEAVGFKEELKKATELRNEGKFDEAADIYRDILKQDFEQVDALQGLALVAHENNNYDVARDLFEKALACDPERFDVWANYGELLNDLKDSEGAERALQNALNLNPDWALAYKSLGTLALIKGEREKGIAFMEKALKVNPNMVGVFMPLAKAKAIKPGDVLVKRMERIVEDPDAEPGKRAAVHYALAYVYQQANDVDTYFYHLKTANKLNYDSDPKWKNRLRRGLTATKKIFTKEFLSQQVGEEKKIYTPIFIVGLPRSGTTLTDQIFGTHSKVFAGDELQYLSKYLSRITVSKTKKGLPFGLSHLGLEDLERLATLYQGRVRQMAPDFDYITDKMPWNYLHVGMIYKAMPWAKVIHIHRDPVDCGFSNYRNPLSKSIEFTCDFEGYAFYRSVYQEYMDFWQEQLPDFFINLKYEELVDHPEREIRRILKFCGLPWEDKVLRFHETKREVRTISNDQVNQPLNRSSIGYAEKYGKHLEPLKEALRAYKLIEGAKNSRQSA